MEKIIGVISDTHGLLRESVRRKLAPCETIIHAGDIGDARVLQDLREIGKVVAVRGNVDRDHWADRLSPTEMVEVAGHNLFVLHNIDLLDVDPAKARIDAVIYGHSHRPLITYNAGILYLNPGSAGPKRFTLPVSMAYIRMNKGKLVPELINLDE